MASTREKLIDWLADLPDNTEIGIEDEDLIVIIDAKAHFFTVGQLPAEAIETNLSRVSVNQLADDDVEVEDLEVTRPRFR